MADKTNEGKAWQTSDEDKRKEMERLMQYEWFQAKSDEDKQMMIPQWSGVINNVYCDPGADLGITICHSLSMAGRPQLVLDCWQKGKKVASQTVEAPAPEPAPEPTTKSDPFGFGL